MTRWCVTCSVIILLVSSCATAGGSGGAYVSEQDRYVQILQTQIGELAQYVVARNGYPTNYQRQTNEHGQTDVLLYEIGSRWVFIVIQNGAVVKVDDQANPHYGG